jgi:hypothetical protein
MVPLCVSPTKLILISQLHALRRACNRYDTPVSQLGPSPCSAGYPPAWAQFTLPPPAWSVTQPDAIGFPTNMSDGADCHGRSSCDLFLWRHGVLVFLS